MILSHLPAHGPNVVVPHSKVWGIYQAPVFDNKIVLWKEKIRFANLVLEDEPVIAHRLSLIIIPNAVMSQIVANDLLSLASYRLTSKGDGRCTILHWGLEEFIQPGKKAHLR